MGHELTTKKSMLPKDTFTTIGNKTDGKSSKQDEVGIDIDNQEKCHDSEKETENITAIRQIESCLLYTSPSPRDGLLSRMPSSA